jgi:exodeoxyribonuclease VII small subunit
MSGKKESFEQRITRLEEIVAALERGDVQLADSLVLFEEGAKLIGLCSKQLDEAEQQVVKLMKGPDGAPVELPFEDHDSQEAGGRADG